MKHNLNILFAPFVTLQIFYFVESYSKGAPCFATEPNHGVPGRPPMTSPFVIQTPPCYMPDMTFHISIGGGMFKGFMLKTSQGSFGEGLQYRLKCNGDPRSITHENADLKSNANFKASIIAPSNGAPIKIDGVVVRHKLEWYGLASKTIEQCNLNLQNRSDGDQRDDSFNRSPPDLKPASPIRSDGNQGIAPIVSSSSRNAQQDSFQGIRSASGNPKKFPNDARTNEGTSQVSGSQQGSFRAHFFGPPTNAGDKEWGLRAGIARSGAIPQSSAPLAAGQSAPTANPPFQPNQPGARLQLRGPIPPPSIESQQSVIRRPTQPISIQQPQSFLKEPPNLQESTRARSAIQFQSFLPNDLPEPPPPLQYHPILHGDMGPPVLRTRPLEVSSKTRPVEYFRTGLSPVVGNSEKESFHARQTNSAGAQLTSDFALLQQQQPRLRSKFLNKNQIGATSSRNEALSTSETQSGPQPFAENNRQASQNIEIFPGFNPFRVQFGDPSPESGSEQSRRFKIVSFSIDNLTRGSGGFPEKLNSQPLNDVIQQINTNNGTDVTLETNDANDTKIPLNNVTNVINDSRCNVDISAAQVGCGGEEWADFGWFYFFRKSEKDCVFVHVDKSCGGRYFEESEYELCKKCRVA